MTASNLSTDRTHEQDFSAAEIAVESGFSAIELAPLVVIGLLVCPPLAILAVVVVVPLLAMGLVLGILGLVLFTPYLILQHLRGHHGHAALLAHRLRAAGRSVRDLAPHRIVADAPHGHPAR
jgi:hypothetical protein